MMLIMEQTYIFITMFVHNSTLLYEQCHTICVFALPKSTDTESMVYGVFEFKWLWLVLQN